MLCEVPITFTQAALGATIQVPTLDGKVDYEIPEGTQTGREFILREKGIPEVGNTRRRGNERFTVVVETPDQTDEGAEGPSAPVGRKRGSVPRKGKKFLNNLKDFFGIREALNKLTRADSERFFHQMKISKAEKLLCVPARGMPHP